MAIGENSMKTRLGSVYVDEKKWLMWKVRSLPPYHYGQQKMRISDIMSDHSLSP